MKKILVLLGTILLFDCQQTPDNGLRIGTIAGPESELMAIAKQVSETKYKQPIEIIEFSDYTLPNAALNDGSLDANVFQHQPYLDETIKAKGYPLVAIAKTFIYPMGVYSAKVHSLNEIPQNGEIAIPNDPSNEARALLLLEQGGIIQLKSKSTTATITDISANPRTLVFKELDAVQLPRVLPDVSAAVINSNYAVPAGLLPGQEAIFHEDKHSIYANLIVVKKDTANDPRFKILINALHSPEVVKKAEELFQGQAIQAW